MALRRKGQSDGMAGCGVGVLAHNEHSHVGKRFEERAHDLFGPGKHEVVLGIPLDRPLEFAHLGHGGAQCFQPVGADVF